MSTGKQEALKKLEEQLKEREQKFNFKREEIQRRQKLPQRIASLKEHKKKLDEQIVEDSKKENVSVSAIESIEQAKKNTEKELAEALEELEDQEQVQERPEYEEYVKLLHEYNALKAKQTSSNINLQAKKIVSSPWGKVATPFNLLPRINSDKVWLEAFVKKHDLQQISSDNKLTFSSSNKDISIEVTQEKVNGKCQIENQELMLQAMLELYIQGLDKNVKPIKHHVDSNFPHLLAKIEYALATELKARGMDSTINNKSFDSILKNPPSPAEPISKLAVSDRAETQTEIDDSDTSLPHP